MDKMDNNINAFTSMMQAASAQTVSGGRVRKAQVPPELHDTADARRLKESCQQFESILWAQIWKKMKATSRSIGGSGESERPWRQMEDLSIEMACEDLAKSGGSGLWKVLYDQMILTLNAQTQIRSVEGSRDGGTNEAEPNA